MKIALLTINDNNNIGNRLQNYASYISLSKYGDVSNIVRKYGCEYKHYPERAHFYYLAKIYHKLFNFIYFLLHLKKWYFRYKRSQNFDCFNNYIRNGETLTFKTNLQNVSRSYDVFVAGSDQIWNPRIFPKGLYINMLGFCDSKIKKISLSSSISQNDIPSAFRNDFSEFLKSFCMLSCREEQGSLLLSQLLCRNVKTLIDPTLFLSSDEWNCIIKKPKFVNKIQRFILLYFLGGITKEQQNIINQYCKKFNAVPINILDEKTIYFTCGPAEFVWLVKNSVCVLTDSFHGTVFSIIYRKNFRVFERNGGSDMNSRLVNLKNRLDISDFAFVDNNNFISFSKVTWNESKLNKEREKFDLYLEEALGTK